MAFFKLSSGDAVQVKPLPTHPDNEKGVQGVIERNLGPIFGVRFVASEFKTGAKHRGRIDTLGLDEDGSPTIIEYKRHTNENVINQGLFYLDWLMDHRGDFEMAAREKFGSDLVIAWGSPRLILLAGGFSRYDQYAVNRIDERIELWTYTFYDGDFVRVERLESDEGPTKEQHVKKRKIQIPSGFAYSLEGHTAKMSTSSRALFDTMREEILALGNDTTERFLKQYIGYRRLRNFCEIVPKRSKLNIFIDGPVVNKKSIGEDYSKTGHWGTGDLRVVVETSEDVGDVMDLIKQAYRLQD